MEYTVNKLAAISGISTRTLRYYDSIGLLKPEYTAENGYRIYGEKQVDLLQQILFYRELGVNLCEIDEILNRQDFDRLEALQQHLASLIRKKAQTELLIENVTKTISSLKGETEMTNKEKFEGFKKSVIEENEKKYGSEIRKRYGDDAIDASNKKVAEMDEKQWASQQELADEISRLLANAVKTGDPACEDAQKACDLHRIWLCSFWKDGTYSKQAHRCLGEGYVSDERFRQYYENIAPGCAEFLRDALNIYCKE